MFGFYILYGSLCFAFFSTDLWFSGPHWCPTIRFLLGRRNSGWIIFPLAMKFRVRNEGGLGLSKQNFVSNFRSKTQPKVHFNETASCPCDQACGRVAQKE